MEWLKASKDDKEARMLFVEYWADYIRTHPDKEWSQQQNMLINSILQSAKQWSRKEYLELKGEKCSESIVD